MLVWFWITTACKGHVHFHISNRWITIKGESEKFSTNEWNRSINFEKKINNSFSEPFKFKKHIVHRHKSCILYFHFDNAAKWKKKIWFKEIKWYNLLNKNNGFDMAQKRGGKYNFEEPKINFWRSQILLFEMKEKSAYLKKKMRKD